MTSALSKLKEEHQDDECVKHALKLRSAWSLNNYRKFYKLYLTSPKMSGYLVDWFLDRERKNHFKLMCKVYVICSFLIYYSHFTFLTIYLMSLGKYDNKSRIIRGSLSQKGEFSKCNFHCCFNIQQFSSSVILHIWLTFISYFSVSIKCFYIYRGRGR